MNVTIKHYAQPTGNSCGPSCLMMAYEALPHNPKRKLYTILEICDMCGTDWVVGTPPDKLEKGLKGLNLDFVHHISSKTPFDLLRETIDKGNIPIVRTITKGIPHWIIVSGYDTEKFSINDPWQGEINYSETQLDNIWGVKDYEFYEIKLLQIKQGVPSERLNDIINWSYPFFEHVINQSYFIKVIKSEVNLEKSVLILDSEDNILGAYLIGNKQLSHTKFNKLIGVEGVLLAVDESIRGMGWGNRLKNYPKTLGVDYIWGQQAEGLNNLNDWLKRRILINEINGVYITAEIF
tara:strand:- start:4376 stop:5254 length:879 start_codon:yes stop_codon:yes gene_type:complete